MSFGRWHWFVVFVFVGSCVTAVFALPAVALAELPSVKVGDQWRYEQADARTGAKQTDVDRRVTRVTASSIEGIENQGRLLMTPDLTVMESPSVLVSGEARMLCFPLAVGKSWFFNARFADKLDGSRWFSQLEASVVGFEKVSVPAGEFEAFKVVYQGRLKNDATKTLGRQMVTHWYAPATRSVVKTEFDGGQERWVRQLVHFRLEP